jgi:hypothetical protein
MGLYKLKGTSGSVIKGSSAECDVQLDEPGVAPRHAEISLVGGNSLLLKDLGSETGTLLNGEAVIETMLGSGDEIRIGTCRWMLQAPGLRPERILTSDAIKKTACRWPRVLIWTSVLTAAAAVAVIKLKPEWLEVFRSLF